MSSNTNAGRVGLLTSLIALTSLLPLSPAAYRRLHLGRKSQRKIHERKSS